MAKKDNFAPIKTKEIEDKLVDTTDFKKKRRDTSLKSEKVRKK